MTIKINNNLMNMINLILENNITITVDQVIVNFSYILMCVPNLIGTHSHNLMPFISTVGEYLQGVFIYLIEYWQKIFLCIDYFDQIHRYKQGFGVDNSFDYSKLPEPDPLEDPEKYLLAIHLKRMMIVNRRENSSNTKWNIHSENFRMHGCYLEGANKAKLYSIANQAQGNNVLTLLDLKLESMAGKPLLCKASYPGRKVTLPDINVYLLVVGSASPSDRNAFLANNPQYNKHYQ